MLPYLVKAESTYEVCQCVCEPLTTENSNDIVFPNDNEEENIVDVENDEVEEEVESENNDNDFEEENIEEEIIEQENEEEIEEENDEEVVTQDLSNINILINELYPAPFTGEEEFIELYYVGETDVDLTGWYLKDESGKKYILSDKFVESQNYLVIYGNESSIILNNGGDTVYLYDKLNNLRQSVTYPSIEKGSSLAYNNVNQEQQILSEGTAGAENVFTNEINEDNTEVDDADVVDEEVAEEGSVDDDNNETEVADIEAVEEVVVVEDDSENNVENVEAEETETSTNEESADDNIVYQDEVLSNYDQWFDDAQLSVTGKVISASGDWKNNRCYLADNNQAIPILCTKLANQFTVLDTIKVYGEVVYRNGVFYRFDPDVVENINEEITLLGQDLVANLNSYSLYKYNGIVKKYSDSYNKITLETENFGDLTLRWSKDLEWSAISEGSVINGLGMADEDGNLWLWEQWTEEELPAVVGGETLSEDLLNNENVNEEEEPEVSVAYLGVGVAGLLGTGKFAWKYKKFFRNIFTKSNLT